MEEMASDNTEHYVYHHRDVMVFFFYSAVFVAIGLIAFNFLIRSFVIKHVVFGPASREPEAISDEAAGTAGGREQWRRSASTFRKTALLQGSIFVVWVSLCSSQSLFSLLTRLQEPLTFVNLFGLMGAPLCPASICDPHHHDPRRHVDRHRWHEGIRFV